MGEAGECFRTRRERVMPYMDGVTGRGLVRLAIGGDGRLRGSEGD